MNMERKIQAWQDRLLAEHLDSQDDGLEEWAYMEAQNYEHNANWRTDAADTASYNPEFIAKLELMLRTPVDTDEHLELRDWLNSRIEDAIQAEIVRQRKAGTYGEDY